MSFRRRFLRPQTVLLLVLVLGLAVPAASSPWQRSGGDDEPDLPLEPAGKLEFTTDEGTWISLDVFPDGQTVVFELLGDLYTVPLAGGTAERITEGLGYDSQPRVSPDGEWIAFISDRDGSDELWIARADGSGARKLSSGADSVISPSWTPDGDYVLVSERRGRNARFRLYHVDGGSGVDLGGSGGDDSGGPGGPGNGGGVFGLGAVMSPDGRYLYFARSGGGFGGLGRWQIGRLDMRSGEVDTLTQDEGSAMRPELSPDGRLMVYATRYETRTGLRVRNLETGEDDWLVWPVQRDEMESGGSPSRDLFPGYSFTPDGSEVVVTFDGGIHRVSVESGDTTPVAFTADVSLDIGPELEFPWRVDQGPVRATLIQDPTQSPDGDRVAFSALTKIYVMDVESGVLTNAMAARGAVGEAGASSGTGPNGPATGDATSSAVTEDERAEEAEQEQEAQEQEAQEQETQEQETQEQEAEEQEAAEQQGPTPLVHSEPFRLNDRDDWQFKPAWSPDGEWIAYVTWDGSGGHVWKQRADGTGEPQRLTEDPAFYTDLVFSPDGQRIVGLRGNEYLRRQTFSEFGGLRIPLDLVWLPADGGEVELVMPARGLRSPHFTDDPDRIHVYSRDGVISMRFDGTDRRTHLSVRGRGRAGSPRPPAAERVLLSPDGRWALAAMNNQLWVMAVPPSAGEGPTVNVNSPAVPAKRITDIGADYFAWADDGETVTWAIGSTFYRRSFDSIEFGPDDEEDAEGEEASEEESEEVEGEEEPEEGEADQEEEEEAEEESDEEHVPLDRDPAVEFAEVVLEFPRATPEGSIVLRHATVITMAGGKDGPVLEDADVVVTDNRITAVGPAGSVDIPGDAREIDASGKYIVPGFVDTHAHWEFRTHDVLEPHNWSLVANLAYGVTSGLDVQTSTNDYFAYRDLVATGQSIGQRAFMTGPGVFSNTNFRSYEQALDYLRRYREHYRTPNIKSYMVGNREQRQWVVKASKELELIPTTEGGRDMKLDITHAIDGMHGNEHTLPVVPLFKDVVELYARTKTAYTPTLLVQYGGPMAREYFFTRTDPLSNEKLRRFYPSNRLAEMARRRSSWARDDEFAFDEAAAQAAKIQRAGGWVGVGGHGEVQGLGYHWEMWALAMGGMTPAEVLQAATIDGARIIGFHQDLGSVEEGKLADLVVLDANPLDDIRNTTEIAWVMKNGELYEGETLDQVWPVERELPAFWWWDVAPEDRRRGGS